MKSGTYNFYSNELDSMQNNLDPKVMENAKKLPYHLEFARKMKEKKENENDGET